MKRSCCLLILLITVIASACTPITPLPKETLLPTITPPSTQAETFTPVPPPTITQTLPAAETEIPPSPIPPTSIPVTETFTPTSEPTLPPTGEVPGVRASGYVTLPNGSPLAGVQINYALSAAPYYQALATTDSRGYYEGFIAIPHQELVRIWAELPGYTFKPGNADKAWVSGEFGWQYYGGYENVSLSFIANPN